MATRTVHNSAFISEGSIFTVQYIYGMVMRDRTSQTVPVMKSYLNSSVNSIYFTAKCTAPCIGLRCLGKQARRRRRKSTVVCCRQCLIYCCRVSMCAGNVVNMSNQLDTLQRSGTDLNPKSSLHNEHGILLYL